jgi:Fis family transcriptional regulator, factor for inversion stimulation protein
MSQTALSIEQDNHTVISQINTSTSLTTQPSESPSLREHVRAVVREYFVRLDGAAPANLYELLMAEMEAPLLEMVLKYTKNNQSEAARCLKLSRGTLRKKMKRYGFLGQNGQKKS